MVRIFLFTAILLTGLSFSYGQEKEPVVKDTVLTQNLDEVIISATRTYRQLSSLPLPAQIVTKKELKEANRIRLNNILNEQTGLITVQNFIGGEGIQMQGLDSEYTLVLIDGVPLVGRSAGTLDISRIAIGNIKQIEIVKEIIEKGFGYEVNGSVYFDVVKFNETNHYGRLSGRNIEDMLANTRDLDGQSDKRNPQDFALWKKAEPQHIMRWPSPWSDGFPGWHLECTAMSTKYLGETFDIHGGGMDLKFPHHECEIAQSQVKNNVKPVNYWLHANMLILNGQKMAKSTGNFILPNEIFSGDNTILSKAFTPSATRFFMLQAHYRSILDFTSDGLEASEKGYVKLMEAVNKLDKVETSKTSSINISAWKQKCYDALNDDFNSPVLIANLFEAVKYVNLLLDKKETINSEDLKQFIEAVYAFVYDVLGLQNEIEQDSSDKLTGVVEMLIKMRKEARDNKDWALSDKIRDELANLGIQLKDGKDGTTFSVN